MIILDEGIPKIVKNRKGLTVEIRDYDGGNCQDNRLKKDKDTGELYWEYRWENGSIDK